MLFEDLNHLLDADVFEVSENGDFDGSLQRYQRSEKAQMFSDWSGWRVDYIAPYGSFKESGLLIFLVQPKEG